MPGEICYKLYLNIGLMTSDTGLMTSDTGLMTSDTA